MRREKMEHYRRQLEKRIGELNNTIGMMKEHNEGEQNKYTVGELSNYDNHPADLGSELYLTELNNALKVHEENILRDMRDALEMIREGTYGTCRNCGKEISADRLEAMPYVKFCLECENSFENATLREFKGRANEELVIDAPFGRKYLNKQEDDEYEGKDQFNDLMKYGSSDTPQDLGGYHDYEEYYTNEIDRQGIVDDMDRISNEEYKRQLPD